MSGDVLSASDSLPLSLERRVDKCCDRFEAAWEAGQAPRIEDYLFGADGPERPKLLRQLLVLEIELRSKSGHPPTAAEYESRFPEYVELIKQIFAEQLSKESNQPAAGHREPSTGPIPSSSQNRTKGRNELLASEPCPPVPDHLGRYRVLFKLGSGTFGDVYLAHDDVIDRGVAIKVPSLMLLASESARDRFLSEARSVGRLEHEGIVRAYDFGQETNGQCYIVYELIDGTNLAEHIAANPLPPADAARIVAQVAEALHYAHLQGLVHRDIKPANILLNRQGRPRITDFGLAVKEEDLPKQRGILAGTLPYMSPEQVRREGHHIDGRSDIYSLGVVLYEVLCGRRPFESKSEDELVEQILHREAKPPRQIKDSIPTELERICLKALSKAINERYTTAKDMADELRRATGRAAQWEEERSPAMKLLMAIDSLDPCDLWQSEATHRNRESAKQLLQEVARLIEQFELQYDELMDVLSSSNYASMYGSANRVGRERLLRANRKLVAIANEMRSIYRGLTRRFILLPDIRVMIDSITAVCLQIAVVEDFLVISGVNNSGELRFDLQKQMELLDGHSFLQTLTIVEEGNSSGDGEPLLRDYHLLLLKLRKYKITLKEEIDKLDQEGLRPPHEYLQKEETNRAADPQNLLHLIWDSMDPHLQDAFSLAYNKKRREGSNRISTRDLFQALLRVKDDALRTLIESLPEGALPNPVDSDVGTDRHLLNANPLLSDCVEDSLSHFIKSGPLPRRLSPVDIFVDIGQHGHGPSVARLRQHGVTPEELEKRVQKYGLSVVRRIAQQVYQQEVQWLARHLPPFGKHS